MPVSATSLERREVLYSGRVQGVGFRYTARHVAQSYGVTGFVRNRDDGRVELVAEGLPLEIDRFLADIAERMGSNIREALVTRSLPTGQYASFDIAY